MHSVLFLVMDFLFVAALYVLLGAQFLAAIQILVYAGGIVVLYLFVVMLVNLKRPPEAHSGSAPAARSWRSGCRRRCCVELGAIAVYYVAAAGDADRAAAGDAGDRQHRAGRLAPLHELSDSVRDRVDAAAGRDDRRDRAGETRTMRLQIADCRLQIGIARLAVNRQSI